MGEYIAEAWSVTNVSSKEYRVSKELGCLGRIGYVVSDGGTVYLQISPIDGGARKEMTIQVDKGEIFDFMEEEHWEIGTILITTDSATALSGRLFLRREK